MFYNDIFSRAINDHGPSKRLNAWAQSLRKQFSNFPENHWVKSFKVCTYFMTAFPQYV